jgi:hypothetical protein
MIFFAQNEMSLEWGESQVVHMNQFVQDPQTQTVCFESTPSFNVGKFKCTWNLAVSVTGLLETKLQTVDHLQNGDNVLIVTGESKSRPIGEIICTKKNRRPLGRLGALARHGGLGTCTRTTWAVGQLGSRSTPPHARGSSRLGLNPKE